MKCHATTKNIKGFSLIELLIVLAVIASLAVAAFVVYPKVRASSIARQEAETIVSAVSSMRSVFPTRNYTNLNNTVAIDAKLFPENMVYGDGEIRNRFDGMVIIRRTDRSEKLFRIGYRGVPSDVCVRLLPMLAQHFRGVSVKGQDGVTYVVRDEFRHYSSSSGEVMPLDEANAAVGCGSSTGKAGEILVFDM